MFKFDFKSNINLLKENELINELKERTIETLVEKN